jgi:predicted enzyme related to lactoylglutathione lyase
MAIRVSETMLFVGDLDEAIRFYTQSLGWKLEERFDWGFAYINIDGSHRLGLMLASAWTRDFADGEGLPQPRVALQTDDFDAEHARLAQAGVHMGAITESEGGVRAVNFVDTDNNVFFLWYDPREPFPAGSGSGGA